MFINDNQNSLAAENAALAIATAHLHKQGLNTDVFMNITKDVRGCDLDTKVTFLFSISQK